jgi:hypothetical protein
MLFRDLLSLQIWFVAEIGGRVIPLLISDPFTLFAMARFNPPPRDRSLEGTHLGAISRLQSPISPKSICTAGKHCFTSATSWYAPAGGERHDRQRNPDTAVREQ